MSCTNKKRSSTMKFNKFLLRVLCFTLVLAVACGVAAKLHVDNKEYKVEFDANGGTGVESQYVVKGGLVTAPADPTREGYSFLGWFHNEDLYNFETPVKGAMTLVAHWEKLPAECPHADKNDDGKCDACGADFNDGTDVPAPTTYSIVYMDGATKLDLAPKSYSSASTGLSLPTPPAKAHFQFVGWFLDEELTVNASEINVNANANLVFYAKYVPVTYTVSYELGNGVNAESNVSEYTVLDLPVLFADPTLEGYEFKGWFTDANCTVAFTGLTAENAGNLNLFAKWEKILVPHTVTYLDKDYNVIATEIFYESEEDQPLMAGYEVDGWVFKGWAHPRMTWNVFTCIPAGTAEDITVIALMEQVIITHTVTYYVDGVEYHTASFDEAEGLSALLFVNKPGYTFDGWYNAEDVKVESIPAGTTEDVALYGSLNIVTYTVKFFDGETELFFELNSYTISETEIALPELPAKDGTTPAGWYTADGEKVTAIAANTTGNLTLFAKYNDVLYTVTYYFNDGSEAVEVKYTYGNVPALASTENRDGYVFSGWYTNGEFSGEAVESLDEYANQDVTLFAKWVEITDEDGTLTPEVPF